MTDLCLTPRQQYLNEVARWAGKPEPFPMRLGICRTLDCYFGSQFYPSEDEWVAIQVYRDGNPIELGRAPTEEEADEIATAERDRQLQDNGQFGVGA